MSGSLGGASGAAAVKKAKPYFQRADELGLSQPVISYYCRLHAVDLLAKGRPLDKDGNALLINELTKVEDLKKSLDLSSGQDLMESCEVQQFDVPDAADRSGSRTKAVVLQFYTAALFLDVCAQFHGGELPPDISEKVRYARFRTLQIRDSLQKGEPVPPPPGSEESNVAASNAIATATEANAGTAVSSFTPAPAAAVMATQAFAAPAEHGNASALRGGRASACSGGDASSKRTGALKQAEFAASALDFGDVETARKCLLEALGCLGG